MVSKKIRVHVELKSRSPQISGDAAELQQVLINLILNAIDAMAATPSERTLSIVIRETGAENVQLLITDQGPGMSPAELKKEGLGLGLPICQSIITSHRGVITLANVPDGGMVATVSLPKSDQFALAS